MILNIMTSPTANHQIPSRWIRSRTNVIHPTDDETTTRGPEQLRDVLLVALTVASGAVDAISYLGLGKTFSAFMTGNMVFLGFGFANLRAPAVLPVIVALSMFAAGAYLGLRFWTLCSHESGLWASTVSVLLVLVATAEAAFLALWAETAGRPATVIAHVLLALFSLAMGIQTAAVRSLGVQGVFTTAGTFTLVAFEGVFAGARPSAETQRLAGVLVGLVVGAIGGGLLFLHARSYSPIMPLTITVLVILVGLVALRPRLRLHNDRLSRGQQQVLDTTVSVAESRKCRRTAQNAKGSTTMTTVSIADTVWVADTVPELTDGYHLVVEGLKLNGIQTIYGVVGIPITDLARIAQASGIRYIGFRHESDAGHAAAAAGFLTKRPGICLTVSAPVTDDPDAQGPPRPADRGVRRQGLPSGHARRAHRGPRRGAGIGRPGSHRLRDRPHRRHGERASHHLNPTGIGKQ